MLKAASFLCAALGFSLHGFSHFRTLSTAQRERYSRRENGARNRDEKDFGERIFILPSGERFSILVFVAMEIMKTTTLPSRTKSLLLCVALATPSLALANDLVLQKAPPLTVEQAPAYPENVARYHLGAAVSALPQKGAANLVLSSNGEDQNTSEAALLCDDPTTGYKLAAGKSSILVSLASIENIQSISLLNEGAKGDLSIAVSNADVPANSPEWRELNSQKLSDGPVVAKVGPGEAKYVRLTFNVTEPGRIAAFGVFATPAVSDFTMPRPHKTSFENSSPSFALINYNYTDLHARARALYASSGDLKQANKMIDDQSGSAYQFAKGDPNPTAVIDLGRERSLTRISALYANQPGSVDFYVLDRLPVEAAAADQSAVQQVAEVPQSADLPSTLKVSDKTLAALKSVGTVVNTNKGRASIDFPEMKGRYVMLKWHPAAISGEGFSVAQVAAFGTTLHDRTARDAGRNQVASDGDEETRDSKDLADGKTIFDNKDIAREELPPAEGPPGEGPPPPLPGPPGFTFIPQAPEGGPVVPPTSP